MTTYPLFNEIEPPVETPEQETARTEKECQKLVGEALDLGIKVYLSGTGTPGYTTESGENISAVLGPLMKSAEELQADIARRRGELNSTG